MATKTFRCLLCKPQKHFSSSEGYKHLDKVHKTKHELGVSHDYVDYPKPACFRGKTQDTRRQYECLLCPAGSRKTSLYSSMYSHVTDHHREKVQVGVTHSNVGNILKTYTHRGAGYPPIEEVNKEPLPYHELSCILRIDKETGKRILILGG